MTDRVKGLYVALDKDYRVDDVEAIINAILMVKGVQRVETEGMVTNPDDWMARNRAAMELQPLILEFLEKLRKVQ